MMRGGGADGVWVYDGRGMGGNEEVYVEECGDGVWRDEKVHEGRREMKR
jgi:hypothetical protein